MSRKQDRIKKQFEKNPVVECNKIQNKYCPKLLQRFTEATDPRHQGYKESSDL